MTTANTITYEVGEAQGGDSPERKASAWSRVTDFVVKHHLLVVFAYLVALELCIFGHSFAKTGFFLDDWLTLFQFKFGPADFWTVTHKYLFEDPRVLIRPIEAPYFSILYSLFGFKAAAYHFVNAAMEVLTALFLYLSVLRLSRSQATSFMASALFIVNPTHDVTHYWMVCSSATLSLMLFMGSFWAILKAVDEDKRWMYVASGVLLTLSLFNYESCLALPLAMVVGIGVLLLPKQGLRASVLKCVNVGMYLLIPVAVTFIYQRYLSSMIAFSWVKRIDGNGSYMLPTITKGLEIQTPWALASFARQYLVADFFTGMNALSGALFVGAMVASALLAVVFLAQKQEKDQSWQLAGLGLLFSVLALAVFGLNSEYMPLMITLVNRVDLGASVGACFITAALLVLLYRLVAKVGTSKVAVAVSCIVFMGVMVFFGLCDRALSQAWLASTAVQNRIREVMRNNAHKLQPGDGVVVVNCPRYVMWAPIADGTWDLQAMLRVAADNDKIFATSVSDRLEISPEGLRDYVLGKEIANLPFDRLYSLEPHTAIFQRVPSATAFIDAAQRTTKQMGIKQSVIDKWRVDLQKQQ